nr:immunoglobulin light chain junction region [Macaca mulatta]MPO03727.1 immunoglobulin light chain junction region [Macaca mulatta]MPO03772.1 immunoglobulin light chain junction region [Macaca mulatta]MPO04486.1 immunoglobulin light chain junction region [Macaca mulatta]MPO05724.1 immunoglobulin light chain junction region [Macaca mulatta]
CGAWDSSLSAAIF